MHLFVAIKEKPGNKTVLRYNINSIREAQGVPRKREKTPQRESLQHEILLPGYFKDDQASNVQHGSKT